MRFAFVVTVPAVRLAAVPEAFVRTMLEGVPPAPSNKTGAPADPVFTARAVATPVPRPDTPAEIGSPVALVSVPLLGVPRAPSNKTGAPADPTATPSAVATFAPRPETPVDIGNPVALVNTAVEGVPMFGVVKTGDVANTNRPEPVSSVTAAARLAEVEVPRNVAIPEAREVIPVPPFATGSVPVTCVVNPT